MSTPDPRDFTVDLDAREVRHASGPVVSFYEYDNEEDWLSEPSCAWVRNPRLFGGSADDLVKVAKQVAIAAGMTHRKPS